jgi:hypothetical protein
MSESNSHQHGQGGHGLLHLILGCGLMLVALLLLPAVRTGWGIVIVIVALLACPILMLLTMRYGSVPGRWVPPRGGNNEDTRRS